MPSDEEKALFSAIHSAKAALMETKDLDEAAKLRRKIGELTQKIRRLRMEQSDEN